MKNKSRRILCVTSNFPRWEGDSTTPFILHLAQDLIELGWEVDVLAPHAPSTAAQEALGGVMYSVLDTCGQPAGKSCATRVGR